MQTQKNIDIFVEIIDNFGDMGFVGEFLYYFDKNFDKNFSFSIFLFYASTEFVRTKFEKFKSSQFSHNLFLINLY